MPNELIKYKGQVYRLASAVTSADIVRVLRMAETDLAACATQDAATQQTCTQKVENQLAARLNSLMTAGKPLLSFFTLESRKNDNSIGVFFMNVVQWKIEQEFNVIRCEYTPENGPAGNFAWYLAKKSTERDTARVRNEKIASVDEIAAWFVQLLDMKVKYRHDEGAAFKLIKELRRQGTPGVDNGIVFFGSVILNIYYQGYNTAYVQLLYVDPKRRNEHLASKVLRLLTTWADHYCCDILGTALPSPGARVVFPFSSDTKTAGLNYLELEKLVAFYGQFGFTVTEKVLENDEEGIGISRKAKNCRKPISD